MKFIVKKLNEYKTNEKLDLNKFKEVKEAIKYFELRSEKNYCVCEHILHFKMLYSKLQDDKYRELELYNTYSISFVFIDTTRIICYIDNENNIQFKLNDSKYKGFAKIFNDVMNQLTNINSDDIINIIEYCYKMK